MSLCECILSDNTLEHLKTVQKILHKDDSLSNRSDVVELLLRYIVSDVNDISVDDLILIDNYFLEHPSFLHAFYDNVMMSATFYLESYCE